MQGALWSTWAKAIEQTTREATILLYAPALDRHMEAMAEVDRVSHFYDMQDSRLGRPLKWFYNIIEKLK